MHKTADAGIILAGLARYLLLYLILTNMMLKKYYHEIILCLLILAFVIFKIPHLSLPFMSDEGFAYGPAVHKMYDEGLGLLPSSLDPEFSYGHPLLFHFSAAGWMKIFGDSQTGAKSFALFLAVLLLFSLYYILKKLFNKDAALLAVVLLMLQPVFITQSSFLLLEIMVTLLGLWTIFFWFERKFWQYMLFSTLLVMTKESGLFLVFALCVWQLIDFVIVRSDKFSIWLFFQRYLILLLPAIVFGIYLVIQYFTYGWFIYPLRLHDLNFTADTLKHNSWWTRQIIFFLHGRSYITLALLVATLVYYFIPGTRLTSRQWNVLWFLLIFIFIYQYISIFNFISNRYFLICNAALIMITAVVMVQTFEKYKWLLYPLSLLLIFSQAWWSNERSNPGDDCLGGIDVSSVHQQTVRYLEGENLYNDRIFTHFLMRINLTWPSVGYLSDDQTFSDLKMEFSDNVKYVVASSTELYETDSVRQLPQLRLLQRYEQYHAWSEIYINENYRE